MLFIKLIRGMWCVSLAYVVRQHVKVAHISSRSGIYLNLDKEMIARAPIVDSQWNLRMSQDGLDKAYINYPCNTFKIVNSSLYHILLKMFIDMDAYVHVK